MTKVLLSVGVAVGVALVVVVGIIGLGFVIVWVQGQLSDGWNTGIGLGLIGLVAVGAGVYTYRHLSEQKEEAAK